MMIRFLTILLGLAFAASARAAPSTTSAPTTLLNTQCSTAQFLLGGGVGLPPSCSAVTYPLLPSLLANQVLGAVTATTPSGLNVPSCSASSSALTWTSGTGFGCNTIATSAPVGTLNLATYAGVTVGAGQTLIVRQNNCTNINAAIAYAETNNLEFDVPGGIYEISCSGGLVIPVAAISGNGFKWRGNRLGSMFVQYYATSPGGPVLTFGDTTGVTVSYGIDFDGGEFRYGVAQTGFTAAETVTIGALANSRITGLTVGTPMNVDPGYDGVLFNDGGNLNYASNTASGWSVYGAQRTLFNAANALGLGNTFDNILLQGSPVGSYNALSGYCLTLGTTTTTEPKFSGLDCIWLSANVVLDLENAAGVSIDNLHLEGIKSTGASPVLVQTAAADVKIGSMQVKNWLLQTANVTGTPKVFRDASATASNVLVHSLNFLNTVSGNVTTPFTVMSPDAPANDNGVYSIDQMSFLDTAGATFVGNVNLDSHMPYSSTHFLVPERVGRYTWGAMGSVADKEVVNLSTTYTHYGQLPNATINVPATVTSFTITLQAVQGATGNAPVALGTMVKVYRQSGTASGTLTVVDDASTTLATSTVAATAYWFIFNGTHFVAFTPVT